MAINLATRILDVDLREQPPAARITATRSPLNGAIAAASSSSAAACDGDGIAFSTISPPMISRRSWFARTIRSANVAGFREGVAIANSLAHLEEFRSAPSRRVSSESTPPRRGGSAPWRRA